MIDFFLLTNYYLLFRHDFIEIMDMIDKRLNDKGKNWRHVFKVRLKKEHGKIQKIIIIKGNNEEIIT